MVLAPPVLLRSYRVFISSGNDVVQLRDRTHRLYQVGSDVLSLADLDVRIDVDRWEQAPAHRVDGAQGPNAEFVRRALSAHLVVALLLKEIRPGTLEELETVLAVPDGPDVAVFCFTSPDERTAELGEFLDRHRHEIIYKEVGTPDCDEAWFELTRAMVTFLVKIVTFEPRAQEAYFDDFG